MDIRFEKTYEMTLWLNEDEARELMGLVQNCLTSDETQTARRVRETIFNALKEQGVEL